MTQPVKYVMRQDRSGKTGYVPRGAALDFWRFKGPEGVIAGPAESGKTLCCCQKVHQFLCLFPGSQAVVVRKVRATMPASVLTTYKKVLASTPDTPVVAHGGETPAWFDYLHNGSRLWVCGMDDPQKVLSSERDLVYVNQAEELTLADWETLCTRATGRAGNAPYSQVLGDCNPGPPHHWLKQRPQVRLFESRHEDNPRLWDAVKRDWTEQGKRTLAALDALTGVRKERLRYGRWVSAEGCVFAFDPKHHVVKPFEVPPARFTIASVDWGLRNPGVLQVWQVDGDGRMYLVHEVYRTGKLIDWWADQAKQAKRLYGVEVFVCDPSEPAYIEAFLRAGLYAKGAVNDVLPGIQAVEARLAVQPDGRPRLMLVEGCLKERDDSLAEARKPVCTQQEFDSYVYSKDAAGRPVKEAPVKENDHGCDATRYACAEVNARTRTGSGTIGMSTRRSPFAPPPGKRAGFGGRPAGGW